MLFKIILGNLIKNFYYFTILVKCTLDDENLNISVNNIEGIVFLYKFKDIGSIFYEYSQSKKVRDYIYHFSKIKNINLIPSSIIKNLSIILYSKYETMTPKYRLTQNRSVLESKLLKNISKLPLNIKISKYNFLTTKYELF